ncbi:MAG: PDDEXK nuclease domain-containing protein [Candidatus Zapsychrus exili]|nr:PDDEXK nuclease domain-containing protein [Candidatus Zapsychrus exili]
MKSKKKNSTGKQIKEVQQAAAQKGTLPSGYSQFLLNIKKQVRLAQVKAALAVNKELIFLYWNLGKRICEKQKEEGWGAKIIDRLAKDLRQEFPEMKGFSIRNLKYMRAFAVAYKDLAFVQQLAAQIPWFHNCTILDKVKGPLERRFYMQKIISNGWSRSVLVHQIESNLYKRQGKALTNFSKTLPKLQSDLAQQIVKDPYALDFLGILEKVSERELENALLVKLKDFLIELGVGFSFVGSQYHLEVGKQDYYLDLLFYHTHLHCYVVIDLKISDFIPEHAGKMNFYLSAVDDLIALKEDKPSIGIILCKTKNKVVVEYALRDVKRPLGVASYKLKPLSKLLKKQLPSSKDFKKELSDNK